MMCIVDSYIEKPVRFRLMRSSLKSLKKSKNVYTIQSVIITGPLVLCQFCRKGFKMVLNKQIVRYLEKKFLLLL